MGFKEIMRPIPTVVGMGETAPYFWIAAIGPEVADEKTQESILKKNHIAFTAESQSPVQVHSSSFSPCSCLLFLYSGFLDAHLLIRRPAKVLTKGRK